MKLTVEKLDSHLKNSLATLYFIHGDEFLIVEECVEKILDAAKQKQFTNPQRITAETNFSWPELLDKFNHTDLFSEKILIKLTLRNGKPGTTGSKILLEYLQKADENCLLIIVCEKLEASTLKTNWYQAIEKQAVTIPVWPLQHQALRDWLSQRFIQHDMNINASALDLFIDKMTGNLLAAQQEIEKLYLIYGPGTITEEQIRHVILDQAHFDIFNLVDAWLSNNNVEYLRILKNLSVQDIATTLIIWALSRDVRLLAQMALALERGEALQDVLQSTPNFRRSKLQTHLLQHNALYYHQLLQHCASVDRAIKGVDHADPWLLLEQFAQKDCSI